MSTIGWSTLTHGRRPIFPSAMDGSPGRCDRINLVDGRTIQRSMVLVEAQALSNRPANSDGSLECRCGLRSQPVECSSAKYERGPVAFENEIVFWRTQEIAKIRDAPRPRVMVEMHAGRKPYASREGKPEQFSYHQSLSRCLPPPAIALFLVVSGRSRVPEYESVKMHVAPTSPRVPLAPHRKAAPSTRAAKLARPQAKEQAFAAAVFPRVARERRRRPSIQPLRRHVPV